MKKHLFLYPQTSKIIIFYSLIQGKKMKISISTPIKHTGKKKGVYSRVKVGIPRSLHFYKYFPLWEALLTEMGCEIIITPETNQNILEMGSRFASNELCIPIKIYHGHILYLIKHFKDVLDYIFVPSYVSLDEDHFFCPKFMALPDTVRKSLNSEIPVLEWEINKKKYSHIKSAINLGKKLGLSKKQSKKAYIHAMEVFNKFQERLREGKRYSNLMTQTFEKYLGKKKKKVKKTVQDGDEEIDKEYPMTLLVLGHPYNTYEPIINQNLLEILDKFHVTTITLENIPVKFEDEDQIVIVDKFFNYWENEKELLHSSHYFLKNPDKIDGVILLISFACGPDSLIQEIIMKDFRKIKMPFLELVLDEHSGVSGILTRIESFIDMIRRKKYINVIS